MNRRTFNVWLGAGPAFTASAIMAQETKAEPMPEIREPYILGLNSFMEEENGPLSGVLYMRDTAGKLKPVAEVSNLKFDWRFARKQRTVR